MLFNYDYKNIEPVKTGFHRRLATLIRLIALSNKSCIEVEDFFTEKYICEAYYSYDNHNVGSTKKDKSKITLILKNKSTTLYFEISVYTIRYDLGLLEYKDTVHINSLVSNISKVDQIAISINIDDETNIELPYYDLSAVQLLELFTDLYDKFVGLVYDKFKHSLSEVFEDSEKEFPPLEELCGIKV